MKPPIWFGGFGTETFTDETNLYKASGRMDDVNKDCIDIFHSNEHEELYMFKEHQRNSLEQLKIMCRVQ